MGIWLLVKLLYLAKVLSPVLQATRIVS